MILVAACSGSGTNGGSQSSPRKTATESTSSEGSSKSPGSKSSVPTPPRPELQVLDAADPDFYIPPSPIPKGSHGDLVRIQPIPGAPDGVTWQRIMYLSETLDGKPTVVTGVLTLPAAEPPVGGWPLFAHAHGSTGQADACAPSVGLGVDNRYSAEILLLSAWVPDRRIAVVSTDYEGLGGPGLHPFLIGQSEGRSVLDSVLAAEQVPGVAFTDKVGIIGYSQGGQASAWANQIAPEWTPKLDIAGVLAGAPATELVAMTKADGEGAAVILAASLAATDPKLDLSSVLTDAGLSVVDQLDRTCEDNREPPPDGPLTKVDITTAEPWAKLIKANVPGDEPGAAPVLIVHSQADQSVPIEDSEAFQKRLCAAGGVVERRVLPDGNHVSAAITAYDQGITWIQGLEAGGKPASTCPG